MLCRMDYAFRLITFMLGPHIPEIALRNSEEVENRVPVLSLLEDIEA
jgi:hypothetical protein